MFFARGLDRANQLDTAEEFFLNAACVRQSENRVLRAEEDAMTRLYELCLGKAVALHRFP
jgi:hypothetical protein